MTRSPRTAPLSPPAPWAALRLPPLCLLSACLLSACATPALPPSPPAPTAAQTTPSQPVSPRGAVADGRLTAGPLSPGTPAERVAPVEARAFLDALRPYCGQAFAGRVVIDTPASANDTFAGKPLVMHVRDCGANTLRVPFHVGEDHSRTWVLTRVPPDGLQLAHDHRHADGTPDAVTMYGGRTPSADLAGASAAARVDAIRAVQARIAATDPAFARETGALRVDFPVDEASIATFNGNGLAASVRNVWAMELLPGPRFVYELARPDGRLFRVEFDLARPVPTPPAPWGSDAAGGRAP